MFCDRYLFFFILVVIGSTSPRGARYLKTPEEVYSFYARSNATTVPTDEEAWTSHYYYQCGHGMPHSYPCK